MMKNDEMLGALIKELDEKNKTLMAILRILPSIDYALGRNYSALFINTEALVQIKAEVTNIKENATVY
jgi:hypothetical protein